MHSNSGEMLTAMFSNRGGKKELKYIALLSNSGGKRNKC